MASFNHQSVTKLFNKSYEAVKKNLPLFALVNSVAALEVAWQIGTNLRDKAHGADWTSIVLNSVLGTSSDGSGTLSGKTGLFLLITLVSIVLSLISVILTVRAAQGKALTFGDIWEEFKEKWLRIIGVEILVFLIVLVGLILLIIPGLYFIGRLIFAPFVLVDQNTGVREAINKSWDMSKGHLWAIYSVMLFGIVLGIPNIVPFIGPIIAFLLSVAYSVALPLRYYEVKRMK